MLSDGSYASLYYNVSYKGHYGTKWSYIGYDSNTGWFTRQSDSEHTVISLSNLPAEGQMDYRVQAQIGTFTEIFYPMQFMDTHYYTFNGEVSGWSDTLTISIPEVSVSASTSNPTVSQSISPHSTVSSTATPSETPTLTPEQAAESFSLFGFDFDWLEVVVFVVVSIVIALLVVVIALQGRRIRVLERKQDGL